jgi:hypothetical protein
MRPVITGLAIVALTAGSGSAATVTSALANVKSSPPAAMQGNPVALPGTLVAQAIPATTPDFSGLWKMDKERSESAAQDQPTGDVIVAITQTGSILKVETTRDGKKELATYPIGDRPTTTMELSGVRRAYWDGPVLIDEGSVDIEGRTIAFREARAPAVDGAEMVVETTLKIEHGYELKGGQTVVTGKNVYVRNR